MNQQSQPITNVYIDGFNFYYGALKGTEFKWLDYRALSERLLRGHQINSVKYFTARLLDRPEDLGLTQRQDRYLRALETHSQIEIFYGKFVRRRKKVPLPGDKQVGRQAMVFIDTFEEKGSDVALGAHLVWDSCHKNMDVALVLSNDSDLQTPINMAQELGIRVVTVNPHGHAKQPRVLIAEDKRTLSRRTLGRSQLPNPVVAEGNQRLYKPTEWL